jgi:hypothetical protein
MRVDWTVADIATVLVTYNVERVYRSLTGSGGTYEEVTGPGSWVDLVALQTAYSYEDGSGTVSAWYKVKHYHTATEALSAFGTAFQATAGGNYLTVQDLRDEGLTVGECSDVRALRLIQEAESYVERCTGRWFYPRYTTNLRIDGSGTKVIEVPAPIIQIDSVGYLYEPSPELPSYLYMDVAYLQVYNRHLTQALMGADDDRNAPRLELDTYERTAYAYFPKGSQNVKLTGWFGFTEILPGQPIGETAYRSQIPLSMGGTPTDIRNVTMRLVIRSLPLLTDTDAQDEEARRPFISNMRTRDQSISYAGGRGGSGLRTGPFTGDPLIDDVLVSYRRQPACAMA